MDSYMYVRSVALYRTVPWSDFLRSQQGLFFFFPCVWIKIGVKKKKKKIGKCLSRKAMKRQKSRTRKRRSSRRKKKERIPDSIHLIAATLQAAS